MNGIRGTCHLWTTERTYSHRILRDPGQAIGTVQSESVLHGVGGEAIEGNLRPHVFFKTFSDGAIHPDPGERTDQSRFCADDVRRTIVSPEHQVMVVDVPPPPRPPQDPPVANYSAPDAPVR